MHEYIGMIHIHSTYSDGSRPIPEIVSIAGEVGLDFLLFSDHNTLAAKRDGMEGWWDKVLVIIGYEINDAQDRNHYLAFNLEEELPDNLTPRDYVRRVSELGGFGIIAHPHEKRHAMKSYPSYPWTAWDSDAYQGLEIWNQMSEWLEGVTHFNKYWRAIHPRRSIFAPPPETLTLWDQVSQKRKVVGVGGVDAHGYKYKLFGFFKYTVFRYKISFKTIRTHLLLNQVLGGKGNEKKDISLMYDALRNCRCFVSNLYHGDASGFRFYAENSREKVTMGQQLKFDPYSYFHVNLPREAEVVLIRDGKKSARACGRQVSFKIETSGLYRVEVYYLNRPWIFSNHLRIV
jgi:hypothetical protein